MLSFTFFVLLNKATKLGPSLNKLEIPDKSNSDQKNPYNQTPDNQTPDNQTPENSNPDN